MPACIYLSPVSIRGPCPSLVQETMPMSAHPKPSAAASDQTAATSPLWQRPQLTVLDVTDNTIAGGPVVVNDGLGNAS